jgi:hypothetical protein
VNNSTAGRISYPKIERAGLTLRLMGAGEISLLGNSQQIYRSAPEINYRQLRQYCDALLGDSSSRADNTSVQADPFRYPDVIRVPFQQDGKLADYFLNSGGGEERYGRKFLEIARGANTETLPDPLPSQQLPITFSGSDGRTYYVIDKNGSVYVERYEGKDVKELSLLGQALWHIFVGEAKQVTERQLFIDASGNVVLEYGGARLSPGQTLTLEQPSQQLRAVDLRGLAWWLNQPDIDLLLKEAAKAWLKYFNLNPPRGQCPRNQFDLGNSRKWWRP